MKWNTRLVLVCIFGGVAILLTFQLLGLSALLNKNEPLLDNVLRLDKLHAFWKSDGSDKDIKIFKDGREVHHIAFVKIHKAASGTTTSILFRFGLSRKLTFVLPKYLNIISSTDTINEKYLYPRLNKTYDIMTSHVIYNKTAFERFLPDDTVYMGILRDPYEQFKSSMNYMQPKYVYQLSQTSPIQEYLKDPAKYDPKNPRTSWINNRQAVEFGIPTEVIVNKAPADIEHWVKQLDKEFHLIIIAEYFDESVVLMRRMFNWQIKDIFYRRLHIRGWDRKITLPRPNDRKLYRKWAAVDQALYDFFFQRLWRQIARAGSDFFDELLYFKKLREEVDDFCKVTPNITTNYLIQQSAWNEAFEVDPSFCKMMFSEEEDFVKNIAWKQYNVTPKPKAAR